MGSSVQIDVEKPRVEALCPECGNATRLRPRFEFVSVGERRQMARVKALCGSPAIDPHEIVTLSCESCREVFLVKVEASLEVRVRVFEVRERSELVLTRAAEARRLKAERMDKVMKTGLYPIPPGFEELNGFAATGATAEVKAFDPEKSVDPLRDRAEAAIIDGPGVPPDRDEEALEFAASAPDPSARAEKPERRSEGPYRDPENRDDREGGDGRPR